MDEKPNRFINNDQEKPLDDNGFSSSNNIDDVDNSVNEPLKNYQNNQSNNKINIPANKNGNQNIVGKGVNAATGGTWNKIKKAPVIGKAAQGLENKVGDKLGLNKNKNISNTDNNNNNQENVNNNSNGNSSNRVNHLQNQRIKQENVPEGLKKAGNGQGFRSRTASLNDVNQGQNQQSDNPSELQKDGLEQKDGLNKEAGLGLGAGLGIKNKLNPLANNEEKKEDDSLKKSLKVLNKVRRGFMVIIGGLASIPFLLPALVLVVIVATIMGPISEAVGVVVEKVQELGQSFVNLFTGKGFNSDQTLVRKFDDKINKVFTLYPEIDKESLRAALYYGFYSFEEFLEELDKMDGDEIDEADTFEETFNYKTLRVYTFTVANQLIYSTVTFDNNLIQTPEEEEDEADYTLTLSFEADNKQPVDKKIHTDPSDGHKWIKVCSDEPNKDGKYECGHFTCKNDDCSGDITKTETKKKIKYTYSCPAGSTMFEDEEMTFCDSENRGIKKINGKETKSADYCINLVTQDNIERFRAVDSNFNEKQKCISYTFETGTDQSKAKFENFLKYVLIPERYYDKSVSGAENYKWDEFVSKFSDLESEDKDNYNIPYHAIGPGKLDIFSSLNADEQREADRTVKTVLSLIKATKPREIGEKYHIPGAASLPLDFQIKDTPEETINSRVTSRFGPRNLAISPYHHGLDFSASIGTPIYSAFDGVVVSIGNDSCGIWAKIGHDIDGDGTYNYYTRYCHMKQRDVKQGDQVMNGQKIGLVGMTGVTTGPHLHFEIWDEKNTRIDPYPYVIDIAKGTSSLSTNITSLTQDKVNQLTTSYQNIMIGYTHTRNGVAKTAKFLVDNLPGLPSYCGGYTTSIIDSNWFTTQVISNSACSNNGTLGKYGLDNVGFINWVFTQNGYLTKQYTFAELKELGNRKEIQDESVQIGDIAYNGENIGIIIDLNETKAVVAFVDKSKGLTTTTVNRKLISSPFKYAVSLSNFYGE